MKLLLVEDDPLVANSLMLALGGSGYAIDHVSDGGQAQISIATETYDLIILDLGLPDMDGLECLRTIRKRIIKVPVLILTARDAPKERIEGLDAGASDYVTKPFHLGELEARIRALQRLALGCDIVVETGELKWNTKTRTLCRGDEVVELSAKEHACLEVLLQNLNTLVTKQRLSSILSGDDAPVSFNAIDIIIHRLRKRLEPYGVRVQTVRGLGFRVEQ